MTDFRSVLIDTNLLVLLIVGNVNQDSIKKCCKTKRYSPADFRKLEAYISRFNKIVITPNIATETCNLLNNGLSGEYLHKARTILAKISTNSEERYLPTADAALQHWYLKFGVTDTCILELAKEVGVAVTDDFKLFNCLLSINVDAVNFNHHRDFMPGNG